jgi:hypothetical protein
MELYREGSIDYEKFHGISDATYVVEFSKPLLEIGFTTEQIMTMYVNKITVDLSIELKQADIEIEKYKLSGGVCNCPDCRKERGEGEEGL